MTSHSLVLLPNFSQEYTDSVFNVDVSKFRLIVLSSCLSMFRKKSDVKSAYYAGNMCLSAIVGSADKSLLNQSQTYTTLLTHFNFG
jgi:hypothetical protein